MIYTVVENPEEKSELPFVVMACGTRHGDYVTYKAATWGDAQEWIGARCNYRVFEPNTGGNPHPSKWSCEIREGGWIIDKSLHDTKEQAEKWGSRHTGDMSYEVAAAYASMFKRWANK